MSIDLETKNDGNTSFNAQYIDGDTNDSLLFLCTCLFVKMYTCKRANKSV